jgi:hypothetical protein
VVVTGIAHLRGGYCLPLAFFSRCLGGTVHRYGLQPVPFASSVRSWHTACLATLAWPLFRVSLYGPIGGSNPGVSYKSIEYIEH